MHFTTLAQCTDLNFPGTIGAQASQIFVLPFITASAPAKLQQLRNILTKGLNRYTDSLHKFTSALATAQTVLSVQKISKMVDLCNLDGNPADMVVTYAGHPEVAERIRDMAMQIARLEMLIEGVKENIEAFGASRRVVDGLLARNGSLGGRDEIER